MAGKALKGRPTSPMLKGSRKPGKTPRRSSRPRFTNIDEFDEIAGYFNKQVSVFEDVYLEIGLLLGARIAFQICGKIAELSDG